MALDIDLEVLQKLAAQAEAANSTPDEANPANPEASVNLDGSVSSGTQANPGTQVNPAASLSSAAGSGSAVPEAPAGSETSATRSGTETLSLAENLAESYGIDLGIAQQLLDELALQGRVPLAYLQRQQQLLTDLGINQLMLYAVIAEWERILKKRVSDQQIAQVQTIGELLDLYLNPA